MRVVVSAAVLMLSAAGSAVSYADSLSYSNVGTAAPLVKLTATATGPIMGYSVSSDAADTDSIALVDLTTGTYSSLLLDNHATTPGTQVNFGTVNAGDELLFVMYNQTTNTYLTSSDYNYDGLVHAYITNYAGGTIGSVTYPAGVYVGFEDLLKSQNSDLDYNDDTFIFTNVASRVAPTPEPGSLALLGTGVLGAAGVMRRRLKA